MILTAGCHVAAEREDRQECYIFYGGGSFISFLFIYLLQ